MWERAARGFRVDFDRFGSDAAQYGARLMCIVCSGQNVDACVCQSNLFHQSSTPNDQKELHNAKLHWETALSLIAS